MNQDQTISLITKLIVAASAGIFAKYGIGADDGVHIITALVSGGFTIGAGLLAHYLHGNSPATKSAANTPTSTTVSVILAFAMLSLAVGCASNPPTVVYKTIGTTDAAVTAAVKAWDVYVSQNTVPVSQQIAVKNAFLKVQASEKLVLDGDAIYAAYGTTNAPAGILNTLASDQAAFTDSLNDLTALLAQFNIKL